MAARNKRIAELATEEIKSQTGREAIFIELDLADLRSVKACAEEFLRRVSQKFLSASLSLTYPAY
jgi:retinol dehydrogenase 12